MITTNVLQRTLRVEYDNQQGTGFTIDVAGRQYLVTARHIVDDIQVKDSIRVFQDNTWQTLGIEVAWLPDTGEDIVILSPEVQLSPPHPLDPSIAGLTLSQDVYFCGYPYGLKMEVPYGMNRGFPIPLVKKGIVSSLDPEHRSILIDGINNPGFSGGPVVFHPSQNSNALNVAGVVSGYRVSYDPVLINGEDIGLKYGSNTGLMLAYDLKNGIDHIANNPSGVKIRN